MNLPKELDADRSLLEQFEEMALYDDTVLEWLKTITYGSRLSRRNSGPFLNPDKLYAPDSEPGQAT